MTGAADETSQDVEILKPSAEPRTHSRSLPMSKESQRRPRPRETHAAVAARAPWGTNKEGSNPSYSTQLIPPGVHRRSAAAERAPQRAQRATRRDRIRQIRPINAWLDQPTGGHATGAGGCVAAAQLMRCPRRRWSLGKDVYANSFNPKPIAFLWILPVSFFLYLARTALPHDTHATCKRTR